MIKEGNPSPDYSKPNPPTTFPPLPEHLKGNSMTQTTSSYIPTISTPFIMPPELKVGEHWYVKFPESKTLKEVEILEVTKHTALVKEHKGNLLTYSCRYKKSDIEFVEKVEKKL